MSLFPPSVEALIDAFARLPGIGRKSAGRLAFHVLSLSEREVSAFAEALVSARKQTRACSICQNLTDGDICPVCQNGSRDASTICVVAEARDVAAIERTREYKGRYHVLHGALSPITGVGPDELRIGELVARVSAGGVREVILATNPDTEGEATAMYIAHLLRPYDVTVTRLAYGIPMGGHLEYADELTLSRALLGRMSF